MTDTPNILSEADTMIRLEAIRIARSLDATRNASEAIIEARKIESYLRGDDNKGAGK